MARLRIKCAACGDVNNIKPGETLCPKCKKPLNISPDACIYLYRQGSPYGIAGGFGIYIDGEPFGHIGNKETLCIPVPYGKHNIHCAVGMSRNCKDLQVDLNPNCRHAFAKVYIKPGFWTNDFVVEPIDPAKLDLKLD